MMGSSSSAHDAKASLGYNPRLLTGERLARMKACAEKASTTFPPAFVNKPQPEDEATTPEGDDALARGRWANERRKPAPHGNCGRPLYAWPRRYGHRLQPLWSQWLSGRDYPGAVEARQGSEWWPVERLEQYHPLQQRGERK